MVGQTRVFFDGSCQICSREIKFYKGLLNDDSVEWCDLASLSAGKLPKGLKKGDALQRFHIQTPSGGLLSGGAAFAHLWFIIPKLRPLGLIAMQRPLSQFLEIAYRAFLLLRPILRLIPH